MSIASPTFSQHHTSTQAIISVRGVHKEYDRGSDEHVIALDNVSLEIRAGELVSLVGPSGCGKSTLLRLIADLIAPTAGAITINGQTPRQARLARAYGMVFQAPTLYEWRTIGKNIQLPLEIMGYSRREREQRTREVLALVELEAFANHWPRQLSGGMQQRASIARALSFRPRILLMDEPFGALDEFTRERMNMELLRIKRQENLTVIFVTHSIEEAVFLSDRVAVMSARPGRILEIVPITFPAEATPDGLRTAETRDTPHFYQHVALIRQLFRNA